MSWTPFNPSLMVTRAQEGRKGNSYQLPVGWEIKETTIESSDAGEVEGFEVVSYGKAPWQVDTAQANITVKNPALTQAMALDANGMPVKEVPVTKTDEGLEFRFPPGHLYVVLQ